MPLSQHKVNDRPVTNMKQAKARQLPVRTGMAVKPPKSRQEPSFDQCFVVVEPPRKTSQSATDREFSERAQRATSAADTRNHKPPTIG